MKKSKILIILILVMFFINLPINKSLAWTPKWDQFDNVNGGETDKAATNIVGALINIITTIGAGLAIAMLVILGIQYIVSNVTGKAKVKESLSKYVTGAVLIFAATGILKLVQMFIDSNINNI